MIAPALPLADLDEKTWTHQLIGTRHNPGLARTLGWTMAYHVLRSKGSEAGFPDWVLVRERVVYLELKREDGKLTDPQKTWIRALLDAAAEAYIVRPADLTDIARVLAHRGDPHEHALTPAYQAASRLRNQTRRETG